MLVIDDLHELGSDEALALAGGAAGAAAVRSCGSCWRRARSRALGLHRLRLAGELTEVRGPDLRFSLDGDAARCCSAAGSRSRTAASPRCTNAPRDGRPACGWRRSRSPGIPDPERFVAEFSGSERTVAGYLARRGARAPAAGRCATCCCAPRSSSASAARWPTHLTGGTGVGGDPPASSRTPNAFVTALDVRAHVVPLPPPVRRPAAPRAAARRAGDRSPSLHRAAAAWHEEHGDVVEAIRHAQAAGDWAHGRRACSSDNYLDADPMAGRGETLHALLGAFPAGCPLSDGDLAAALAIDGILRRRARRGRRPSARRSALAARPRTSGRRVLRRLPGRASRLELARRRGDLPGAQEAMRALEAALGARSRRASVPVRPEYRALALMNLGIAELWAGCGPTTHGSTSRTRSRSPRRIARPFIEIGCLAHLAIAAPLTGQPLPLALELSERALAIAEEHGWTEPVDRRPARSRWPAWRSCWLGRFAEAEQPSRPRGGALRDRSRPGDRGRCSTTPAACCASARAASTRPWRSSRARSGLNAAARRRARARGRRARPGASRYAVRMGDTAAARAALAGLSRSERDRAGMRIALAALALARGRPGSGRSRRWRR